MAAAGLTPEQLQRAIEQQVSMKTIQGSIQGPLGHASFQGVATYGYLDGQFVSYFVIAVGTATTNGPPALTQPANVDPGDFPPLNIQPHYPRLPQAACDDCDAVYNDTVAGIQALYQAQVSAAEREKVSADEATHQTLLARLAAAAVAQQNNIVGATATYAVLIAGCTGSLLLGPGGPLAATICWVTASAGYSIAIYVIAANYADACAAAQAQARTEYDAHYQTYAQRADAARANAEAAEAAAMAALQACYRENGCVTDAL